MSLSKPIDDSRIITVTVISPSLKCVYCKNILRNAMQSICGCRYCEECIYQYLSVNDPRKCYNNTEDCEFVSLTDSNHLIRVDHAARKELLRRKVKCLFADYGCNETPEFRNLENHLSECSFSNKLCNLCNQMIAKSNEKNHAENECQFRLTTCDLCGMKNIRLIDLESRHRNLKFYDDDEICCSKYESPCPYCNVGNFNRDSIKIHVKECRLWRKKCMFSKFGCSFEGDVDSHYNDEMHSHLKMICDCIKMQDAAIMELENDGEQAIMKIKELKQHQKALQTLATDVQIKTADILETCSTSATNVTHYDRSEQEFIPRNGCLVWKITNYKEKCESTTSYYTSNPFYTSNFGYKLSARIYLNGDGAGQGTHVSLFIVIMPGEYDDVLSWPFKHKVTISILDQNGRNNPYSHTFRPDPSSPCFLPPKNNLPNVASGVPCFIRKALLDPDSGSRFIAQNSIFVKVQVDVSS